MNRRLALALLPCALASAAVAGDIDLSTPFGQLTEDYKKPIDIPSTLFNPFKVQIVQHMDEHGGSTMVSDDAVREALTQKGLSGLLFAESTAENRAIIGDEIFGVGDELQFVDDKGATSPLVANAVVTLRGITAQTLVLELSSAGDPPHTIAYSLRTFLAP